MPERNPYLQQRLQNAADAYARILTAETGTPHVGTVKPASTDPDTGTLTASGRGPSANHDAP